MPGNELEVLSHYKRKIEKNPDNEEILLRSLAKLDGVRVNIALLQDTGIGRTVSLLKKKYGDQEIGTKSRDLVTKWKEVVAREESDEDREEVATGDEEAPEVEANGHGSPPSYIPTPIAPAYVPTPLSGYVPTPLSELKHESRDSENHTSDDPYENESEEHNGTNGYGETEVTQRNGEDSDKEHHRKSKKHKKDKDREKDKNRYDEEKEKLKKKKSSHRDNSEEETDTRKNEIKSEYIKKETISHSPQKKDKNDREERNDKEEKKDKHTHEEKKDKHSNRDDRKDKDKRDKQTKERENKEKSREHKSSSSDNKSRHEKSNGEHSKSSSSKHSESKDKDKERKSHKDKHRDRERTKDESDKKHSSKSKDRPKNETEESQDKLEKQRLKDKKKKSENASMAGFDMFASMDGNSDKKHKKRPREDSTEENEIVKPEETYKPTNKQPRVDSTSDLDPSGSNGFSAVRDHKKFKLPTPPTIDPTTFSSGPSFIPDISPHYKPLPRAPPPPNNHKTTDEGVTLDALIASRGKRQMAVYSGAKRGCGFKGEVPSLRDQCIQKLQDNVDDIYECGGLSFDVLEPILNRASPETLMQIELYNPYLMEDTGQIWERFCKKEFRNKTRNADDFESWREMYERCIREREDKLSRLKDKVSKNFNARGEAKDSAARQTKMAFVDQVSKPPREVRVQQVKNGTALPVGHSFKPGAGNSKVGMRNSDPTSGSRSVTSSKKPKTAPMMAKVRRMMRR